MFFCLVFFFSDVRIWEHQIKLLGGKSETNKRAVFSENIIKQ